MPPLQTQSSATPIAQLPALPGTEGWTDPWLVLPRARELLVQSSGAQRLLLALAVFVPLLLAALFAVHQRARTISEAHDTARRSVVALEQHAANVLDAHALILRQVDVLTHGRSWDQVRNDELLRLALGKFSRVPQVHSIGVTDAGGNLVTNTLDAKSDGQSVADRDYFTAHRRGAPAGLFVSQAFTGGTSIERQFAVSIRRNLPNGEFGGILFSTVPLEHFTGFWRGFTPSGGHLIPMVRPDGAVIVRYPRTDSPTALDPGGPFVSHLSRSRKGLYTAVSQVDGIERINAYSQVKDYPLFISFSIETATVLQGWRAQVLAAASIAALVAGLLVALWIAAVRQSHAQRRSAERWEAAARALQAESTRRQEAEESMRVGAQRVSFGDQLIGIVSHDLRNPLNTISLTAEVMARRDALGPQDALLVQRIQNAAQRAARLIRDLLDFTQARLGGRIPVNARATNIHELLRVVLAELEAAHPGRIACSLDAADPHGQWDADRLAQVVENLVANALKYGEEGGVVHVRALSEANLLVLQVSNAGVPIPPEKIALMFEPLQRTGQESQPNPDRSIGMGLFIVRHIVEAHGGTVSVESTTERTTFTVRVPREARA